MADVEIQCDLMAEVIFLEGHVYIRSEWLVVDV